MTYVDGFVVPVPADKVDEYCAIAKKAGPVWIEHGALSYIESVGDDMEDKGFCKTFPAAFSNVKDGEVLFFSFITYKSRAHRDEVNAKVMADPRLNEACHDHEAMPFDCKRMAYGGFRALVDLKQD